MQYDRRQGSPPHQTIANVFYMEFSHKLAMDRLVSTIAIETPPHPPTHTHTHTERERFRMLGWCPRTDLFPVPTKYVLVPCRVINPGFNPSTRTTRELNRWTFGRLSKTDATREAIFVCSWSETESKVWLSWKWDHGILSHMT